LYTPSDEVTMSDPNGNTWTWYKEGPALHRKEGVLTCDVIRNHVGLLQQAAMRIVTAGGSVNIVNTAAADFT